MTVAQLLKFVNYICVKENSGSTLKPDQYNTILNASDINFFNKQVGQAQLLTLQSKMPFSEALYSIAALREFHLTEDITITAGVFDLTTLSQSYAYWMSMFTVYGGVLRKVDLLTDKELTDRLTNLATKQLNEYPGAILNGNNLNVYPSNITSAKFTYLKNPTTPVFDYYYDANLNLIPLAQGTSHTLTSGEVGSAGQTSGQTVTSLTTEVEWNQLYHVEFAGEILKNVGINLKDIQIQQYAKEVEGKQI